MTIATECGRLWREYSQATTRHIELVGKNKIAVIQRDQEAVTRIENDLATAEHNREKAREAIRRHESSAHPDPVAE